MKIIEIIGYCIFSYVILSTIFVWWFSSLKKYNNESIGFIECLISGWKYTPRMVYNEIVIIILNYLLKPR